MATVITMPRYGANMEEGTVAEWQVAEGDYVEKGQVIGEIATEKLSNELESPESGTVLKLIAAEDDTLACGEPIAIIGEEGEDISDLLAESSSSGGGSAEESSKESSDSEATVVKMPRYGANMEEGTVAEWQVAEGDYVEKGQVIGEIATEKLSNELESPASGTVRRLLAKEDDTLPCGAPIAVIADKDADISELLKEIESGGDTETGPEETAVPREEPAVAKEAKGPEEPRITPKALELAEEKSIDYRYIKGTGRHGAITREDVKNYVASGQQTTGKEEKGSDAITPKALDLAEEQGIDYSGIAGTGRHGMITREDIKKALKEGAVTPGSKGPRDYGTPKSSVSKMSQMQKVIAQSMSKSLQETAQTTMSMDVDATSMVEAYRKYKESYKRENIKLSYTAILIKAVSLALIEHKDLRTTIEEGKMVTSGDINIGVAVDVPGGLVVPNIKKANEKDVKTIARELDDIARRARNDQLEPEEMEGGTFTVTNLGMYGIKYFTPVLNLPESAILGVGTLTEQPTVKDGGIFVKNVINLSLTHDHRVVNGAPAALFLNEVKQIIDDAEALL